VLGVALTYFLLHGVARTGRRLPLYRLPIDADPCAAPPKSLAALVSKPARTGRQPS
jgi:hypothetical protein